MPITITNNNSVVGVSQEVNTIQVGMASAFDASATALQAAAGAEAARDAAEAAAAEAEVSAAQAALYDGPGLDDAAAVNADTVLTYTVGTPSSVSAGDYITTRADGRALEVVASGAEKYHRKTASGVRAYDVTRSPMPPVSLGAAMPRFARRMSQYKYGLGGTFGDIEIMGLGSSVSNGATLANPTVDAPLYHFTTRLAARIDPAGIYTFTPDQRSVGGSAIVQANSSGGTAGYFTDAINAGAAPKAVLIAYGMNDFQPSLFNSGQTFPGAARYLRELVRKIKRAGADVIIMTTPHPHTGRQAYSLPESINQAYPEVIAKPVAAEDMTPPASESVVAYLHDGVSIGVDVRFLRGNEMFRQVAFEEGCALIDVEPFWFDALASIGVDNLYDAGESVHPNLTGHSASYHRAIDMFVDSLANAPAMSASTPDTLSSLSLGAGATQLAYDQAPVLSDGVLDVRGRTDLAHVIAVRGSDGLLHHTFSPDRSDSTAYAYNQSRTAAKQVRSWREVYLNKGNAPDIVISLPALASGRVYIDARSSSDAQATCHMAELRVSSNTTAVTIQSSQVDDDSPFGWFTVATSGLNIVITPANGGNKNLFIRYEIAVL